MRQQKLVFLLVTGLILSFPPVFASAQNPGVSPMMTHLETEYGIQKDNAPQLRQSIEGYFRRNGEEAWLRDAVAAFWEAGCQQTCLSIAIRGLNRAKDHGLNWEAAFAAVNEELASVTGNHDVVLGKKLTEQLRLRLAERIGDPMTAPTLDDRARALERSMERESEDVQPAKTWDIRPQKKKPQ
ncbi:MAG: hypothetical protein ACE5FN_03955 [Leptospirillia bacterium]